MRWYVLSSALIFFPKTILRWQILIFLSLLSILAIFQVVLVKDKTKTVFYR